MNVAKNMDSVFANAMKDDTDFDVMFDQEDSLIDTVNGVNEAGDPLTGVDFEDLHQTQDEADPDDVRDYAADDDAMGAPNPEAVKADDLEDYSVGKTVDKDSEADKFYGDAEDEYQTEEVDVDEILDGDDDDEDEAAVDEKCCKEAEEDCCPECKHNPCTCECEKEKPESSLTDSIEKELENDEKLVDVKESEELVDTDVAKVDDSDMSDDDEVIDMAMGVDNTKYEYEPSDEDLIDMAMNDEE